ncbi:hypothetical protein Tco_0507429 [Tanacetum coccineum]
MHNVSLCCITDHTYIAEVRIIESDTSTKAVKISSDDTETSFQTLEISYDDTRKNRVVVSKANSKSTNISKSDMCEWYLSTSSDEDSTSNEDSSYDDKRSNSKDLQAYVGASEGSKILLGPIKGHLLSGIAF